MSKRRKVGDRVYLIPNAGITNDHGFGTIRGETTERLGRKQCACGDPDCQMWTVVAMGYGNFNYMVLECEMLDEEEAYLYGRRHQGNDDEVSTDTNSNGKTKNRLERFLDALLRKHRQ